MSEQPQPQSQHVEKSEQRRLFSSPSGSVLFYCPGESQPIDRALHLARLERSYPKCRHCEHREDVGPVSERRARGIRTILFEAEPIVTDRFVITGEESDFADMARFKHWAARFGLLLRRHRPDPLSQRSSSFPSGPSSHQGKRSQSSFVPHIVLADASSRTMPGFVAAVCDGLRWAGCDVTDLGRGAVGLLDFAKDRLNADAGLLLSQPRQWEHECGLSLESFLNYDGDFGKSEARAAIGLPSGAEDSDAPVVSETVFSELNRPARRLGRLHRASLTDLYEKSFGDRYHALRPLRIALYTSCIPMVDVLRRLTAPFDVRLEAFPFSVVLREGDAVELFGAHFSVYIDGTGRVVELLDEQGVPFFSDVDDLASDAVEVITSIQTLLSRSDTPLSELTFPTSSRRR